MFIPTLSLSKHIKPRNNVMLSPAHENSPGLAALGAARAARGASSGPSYTSYKY